MIQQNSIDLPQVRLRKQLRRGDWCVADNHVDLLLGQDHVQVHDWHHRRLLKPIGNIPPAEAEAHYYAQINELAMVA